MSNSVPFHSLSKLTCQVSLSTPNGNPTLKHHKLLASTGIVTTSIFTIISYLKHYSIKTNNVRWFKGIRRSSIESFENMLSQDVTNRSWGHTRDELAKWRPHTLWLWSICIYICICLCWCICFLSRFVLVSKLGDCSHWQIWKRSGGHTNDELVK